MPTALPYVISDEIVIHCDGFVIMIVPDEVIVTFCCANANADVANVNADVAVADAANAIAFVVNNDVCEFDMPALVNLLMLVNW